MRRLAVLLLALVVTAAPGVGWGEEAEERMVRTVMDQLLAFRRGDFAGAYAHASSGIRARFGLAAFQEMVTGGYPVIARSVRADVRDAEEVSPGQGLVVVWIVGQDGQAIEALYELLEEDGAWRIAGVVTRPVAPGTSTGLPGREDGAWRIAGVVTRPVAPGTSTGLPPGPSRRAA